MLNLQNQARAGRKLTDIGRVAFVLAVPTASTGRWSRVYENFVRSDRLNRVQNEALEAEHECIRWQNVRLNFQQQLIAANAKLRDLHSELRNVSTVDKKYPVLIAEELQILKSVRALSYDFHLHEEAEKEKFLLLERVLAESQKEEWSKAKRSQRFLTYACVVGLAFGITGTLISIFLHGYLLEDPELKGNRLLTQLASTLAIVTDARNKVIRAFLQDVAVLLDTTSEALGYDELLTLPSADVADVAVVAQFQKALNIFEKENTKNSEEMKRLLLLMKNRQQSQNLNRFVILPREQEVQVPPDISPLWRTTFFYGLMIVAVPVAYTLLT